MMTKSARLRRLDFDPADHPDQWELVGTTSEGVPIYSPIDIGGCGGCDNGECCGLDRDDDLGCCGQGEYGPCSPVSSRDDCTYVHDGHDTDGTEWFRCLTHGELAPSPDAPCAGYIEAPYEPTT